MGVMESDGTALIPDGSPSNETFQAVKAVGSEIDWPSRLRYFIKRSAASAIDTTVVAGLSLIYFGAPFGAALAFSVWEPSATASAPDLGPLIEHGLQAAFLITLLTQFYFYPALCESSSAQAGPGKVLFGLKATDRSAAALTFGGVLRHLSIKYCLFFLICSLAYYAVTYGSDYIASLRLEQMRLMVRVAIVIAAFALCIVTEREQTLFDILSGRQVVEDGSSGVKARVIAFIACLKNMLCALGPWRMGARLKVAGEGRNGRAIVSLALGAWTYLSLISALVFIVFFSRITMAMGEVESGIKQQNAGDETGAKGHFRQALALTPGLASIYQYGYAFNDNVDLTKQAAACTRLFAIRGNAWDYLARGRMRAKQQDYKGAEEDYRQALSGGHGQLDKTETASANSELMMLKLEEEAAKMQSQPVLPIHTTPFDMDGGHLK